MLVGGTKVEFLGVGPLNESDLEGIPTKDALFVASHAWALDTASPITVVAGADRAQQLQHAPPDGDSVGVRKA
ncbi:MAG: hypothetical protein ABIX10_03825 [Acidimicrobiales bacterium]